MLGVIMNRRDVENEEEKVTAFASSKNLPVLADIPRSKEIIKYEDMGMTVVEGDADLDVSRRYIKLAERLLEL